MKRRNWLAGNSLKKTLAVLTAVLLLLSLSLLGPGTGTPEDKEKSSSSVPCFFFLAGAEDEPVVTSETIGGDSFNEQGVAIALDSQENILVAGETGSRRFPRTKGAFDESYNGGGNWYGDIFVLKLDSNGKNVLWSSFIGGSEDDRVEDLVVDEQDNVYITGITSSPNFPVTENNLSNTLSGSSDAIICKLSANGSELLYSSYLGGTGGERGVGLCLGTGGEIYVTGSTSSQDFQTTSGSYDDSLNASDIFVGRISPNGTEFLYSTFVGGGGNDRPTGMVLNSQGEVCVAGATNSSDFPTSPGSFNDSFESDTSLNCFVFKLSGNGSKLLFSSFVGVYHNVGGITDIALDNDQQIYLSGYTDSRNWPTTSDCLNNTYTGHSESFVTKLNHNGSRLLYSTYLGGSGFDSAYGMALDSENNVYLTGSTTSSDFPTTSGAYDRSLAREDTWFGGGHMGLDTDVFVCKLDLENSKLIYSTYVGGEMVEGGHAICLDSGNNACVAGITDSEDFPTSSGAYDEWYNGDEDVVVFKLDSRGRKLKFATYVGDGDWRGGFLFFSARQLKAMEESFPLICLALLGALALATVFLEPSRYRFLGALAPFYTRLTGDQIDAELMEETSRGRIYSFVSENPGSNLTTIREDLRLGHGTVIYHLAVLQRTGLLRSASRGREKRFWLKPHFPRAEGEKLTKARLQILFLLREHGELSRTELRELTGLPKATLRYNIRDLVKDGRIREERRGLGNFCFLCEGKELEV